MASHDIATDEIAPYLTEVIGNHPELAEAGVTFDALFALSVDGTPAGVKHNGYPAPATYKVNGPTFRKRNLPDVTLVIEKDEWALREDDRRRALLDRVLSYIGVSRKASGEIKEDEAMRPKLTKNVPDYRVEGFRAVAGRHGGDSDEVRDAAAFREHFGDLLFADEVASVA